MGVRGENAGDSGAVKSPTQITTCRVHYVVRIVLRSAWGGFDLEW